jgi:LysR family transcriptional regulator, chromosome initiation inhibitor
MSPMLDYPSLAAVAAVVREGSFERAARALSVTPSAISQRVKQLEERLGTVLIIRGQPCTATDTGRLLCGHMEHVGLLERELRGALPKLVQTGSDDNRITLRVAVNADSLGTWFIGALAQFTAQEEALLDVAVDDQDHTVEWLRSGEVLAAVTAHAKPVQGCNSVALGRLNYVAVASPAFVRRYLSEGVTAATLARAPSLRFNRKDRLQDQWARRVCRRDVEIPTHWFPSTQAFIDASVAGMGWGMNPVSLVREHLKSGALVELVPGRVLAVPLYWQHTRLQVPMLGRLTRAVVQAARGGLR